MLILSHSLFFVFLIPPFSGFTMVLNGNTFGDQSYILEKFMRTNVGSILKL
jgi:hypothetical protein